MTRREIRKNVFLLLFRKEFYDNGDLMEQLDIHLSQLQKSTEEEKSYIYERIKAILEKINVIDDILSEAASGWTLNRMGKVELTILRLAVYEMRFDDSIPVKVAINEAVELAKIFGGDDTPGFINGVLAKLA
ncbi:MAG TPA: transcription antitermination factor NusB [Clostridiales bacterium]|jgi:N utilization substance protein B|nr:transcription antitermination factor NusB [Clostridiales bacterium]